MGGWVGKNEWVGGRGLLLYRDGARGGEKVNDLVHRKGLVAHKGVLNGGGGTVARRVEKAPLAVDDGLAGGCVVGWVGGWGGLGWVALGG